MAGLMEFNSFVSKFVNLWQNGLEANLHVNSEAGEAFINLQVGLGQVLPFQHRQPGPSRLRCRQRRAESRSRAAEEAAVANNDVAVEITDANVGAGEATKVAAEVNIAAEKAVTKTTVEVPTQTLNVAAKVIVEAENISDSLKD